MWHAFGQHKMLLTSRLARAQIQKNMCQVSKYLDGQVSTHSVLWFASQATAREAHSL